jgi:hypothetical protein
MNAKHWRTTLPVRNQRDFPTRAQANATAANLLRQFINEIGVSTRRFAEEAGISESTLRFFLSNGNATNVTSPARRHGRGPYLKTLTPLLKLALPDDVRDALTDAIHYEDRVIARIFGNVVTGAPV